MNSQPKPRLIFLAEEARREAELLLNVIPIVLEAQWSRNRNGARAEDAAGVQLSDLQDPTGDLATDELRLYLRRAATRGERLLATAVTTLRGVRRGLELALSRWEGPEVGQAPAGPRSNPTRAPGDHSA